MNRLAYLRYRFLYHVPRPIYWWFADTFKGNNGWRPLSCRGRDDREVS